jgi:hypothetical protein
MPRFLSMIRIDERNTPADGPSPELQQRMGVLFEEMTKAGVMVETAGLTPSSEGTRVTWSGGQIGYTDGPFTESKEVIGGWAILDVKSKADAVRIATEFMELHRKHWPEFEGESEVRPMFDPGMGP